MAEVASVGAARTDRRAPRRPGGRLAAGTRVERAGWGFLGALIAVALVELLPRVGIVDRRYFPPFSEMVHRLGSLLTTSGFWEALGATLRGWLLGLAIAMVLGIVVGMAIGSSRLLHAATSSTVEFLRPIPSVALIPLVVLLLGVSFTSTLVLVVYGTFWQVVIQVIYGVRDVDPVARDTTRSYRLGRGRVLTTLIWPTALPYVFVGLRLAASVALILEVTGELIIGSPGLGKEIALAQSSYATPSIYALVIVTGLLGLIANVAPAQLERRLLHWHASVRSES